MPWLQELLNAHMRLSHGVLFTLAMIALWRSYTRRSGALLATTAGLLGFMLSLDPYLHRWDERFHAVVAKHLLRHPLVPTLYDDLVRPAGASWNDTHVWLHKPPLALWLMAASLRVFGFCETSLRLPSVALFALATVAVYAIGRELLGEQAGWLGGALYATYAQMLFLTSGRTATDHPDSILCSLVVLGVWTVLVQVRRGGLLRASLIGALTGLAILAKSTPGILIPALWLVAVRGRRPLGKVLAEAFVIVVAAVAIALPWHLWTHKQFPVEAARESAYEWRHFTEPLEGHGEPWWFHLVRVFHRFGPLVPFFFVWFVWAKVLKEKNPGALLLTVWVVVVYAVFAIAQTKMVSYTMPCAAALLLMMAAALDRLGAVWKTTSRRSVRVGVALAWLLTIGWHVGRFLDVWSPHRRNDSAIAVADRLRDLARTHEGQRIAVFNSESPIEAMFYVDGSAYVGPPTADEVRRLKAQGYAVITAP